MEFKAHNLEDRPGLIVFRNRLYWWDEMRKDTYRRLFIAGPVAILPLQCCPKCASNGQPQPTKAHHPLSPVRPDELSMPHPLQK